MLGLPRWASQWLTALRCTPSSSASCACDRPAVRRARRMRCAEALEGWLSRLMQGSVGHWTGLLGILAPLVPIAKACLAVIAICDAGALQIGRASCRERVCQYV